MELQIEIQQKDKVTGEGSLTIGQHILPPDSRLIKPEWFNIQYLSPQTSKSKSDRRMWSLVSTLVNTYWIGWSKEPPDWLNLEKLRKAVHLQLPACFLFSFLCGVFIKILNTNYFDQSACCQLSVHQSIQWSIVFLQTTQSRPPANLTSTESTH